MNRFRVFASCLVVLAFCSFAAAARGQNADWANRLFAETRYDYRGIPRNTLAKHSFAFVNNAGADVRVVAARTSCRCTRVYAPINKTFKPGESGEIVAEIDAVRYTGVRHATVTVVFDGPTRAEVSLDVRGLVVENVRLDPPTLTFDVDELDVDAAATSDAAPVNIASRTRSASILYANSAETVVKAESSSSFLSVQVGAPVRTNAGMKTPLTVSLAPDAPAGYFHGVAYLWSNGVNRATPTALTVEGVVRPKISIAPPTLTFAASDVGEKIVKNVVVAGSKPFIIKSVQCPSRAVEIDFAAARRVGVERDAVGDSVGAAPQERAVYVLPVAFDPTKLDAESATTELKIETADGRALTLDVVLSAENFARRQAEKSKPIPTKAARTPVGRASFR